MSSKQFEQSPLAEKKMSRRLRFYTLGEALILVTLVTCLPGQLLAIEITGDPTTTVGPQWTWQGNSLGSGGNPNGVIWADGSNGTTPAGFGYDVYTAAWYLTGTETVASGVIGNTQASLSSGAFNAGDHVLAIGWKLDPGLVAWNNSFLKIDPDATPGTLVPATLSDFLAGNATNTSFSANSNTGDFQISASPQVPNEFRVVDFRVHDSASGSYYPFQGNVGSGPILGSIDDVPVRTFTVPYSPTDPNGLSQIMLLNITDLAGVSFTDTHSQTVTLNPIGSSLLLYMQLGGVFSGENYPGQAPSAGATGVVITIDTTPQPVPEPSSLVLVALGVTGLGIARWQSFAKKK